MRRDKEVTEEVVQGLRVEKASLMYDKRMDSGRLVRTSLRSMTRARKSGGLPGRLLQGKRWSPV